MPAIMPPSTTNSAPRREGRVVAREEHDGAGDVGRDAGPAQRDRHARSGRCACVIDVWMKPGCTELTRIPSGPSSTASDWVSPRTPNFDAM